MLPFELSTRYSREEYRRTIELPEDKTGYSLTPCLSRMAILGRHLDKRPVIASLASIYLLGSAVLPLQGDFGAVRWLRHANGGFLAGRPACDCRWDVRRNQNSGQWPN